MRRTISFRHAGFTVLEVLIVLAVIVGMVVLVGPDIMVSFEAPTRSKISRVRTDHRSLATAIENYYVDNNCYPAMRPFKSDPRLDLPRVRSAGGLDLSFVEPGQPQAGLMGLTTPVAFLTSLFPDPYAPVKGMDFPYCVPKDGNGWILLSPGPDGVYSLAPAQLETVYDTSVPQPSALLLAGAGPRGAYTYDPTNGTESAGDLWRVKQ